MKPWVAAAALVVMGCGSTGGTGDSEAADRGHELYLEGKLEAAEKELAGVVRRDPKDSFARRVLGRILLLRGKNAEAADQFLSDVTLVQSEKVPVDAMAVQDLFWAFYRLDAYERAAKAAALLNDSVFAVKYGEMARRGPPYTTEWQESPAVLSFEGSPTVSIRINRMPGRVAIDFGSGEIVVGRDFAKDSRVKIAGVPSPGVERDEQGIVESVDIGGLQSRNVPVVVGQVRGGADGVLGVSLFSHFQTTYDLRRGRLVLRPSNSPVREGESWPLYFAGDRTLLTRARIDGIDTFVIVNPAARGVRFIPSQAMLLEKQRKTGKPELQRVEIGSLSIPVDTQTPERFPAGVDVAYGFTVGGLVGEEAFRNRSVTFDFKAMKITLE